MLRAFHIAFMFMTTLPVPAVKDWQDDDARLSLKAYPLVGLVIGSVLLFVFWLTQGLSDWVQAVLVIVSWMIVTGALHFDGFCDTADAVFASKPAEERQKIARDVSVGAFALAAGTLLIFLKVAALATLDNAIWLLLIPVLTRTLVLIPMRLFKVAGSSQLARSVSGSWSDIYFPLGLGLMVLLIIALIFGAPGTAVIILGSTLIFILFLGFWITRRMDGLSGDAYGAMIESSEAFILVVVSVL